MSVLATAAACCALVGGLPQPPDPRPMPQVIEAACPWDAMVAGCYYETGVDGLSAPVIYIHPDHAYPESGVLEHEKGHALDAQNLTPKQRRAWRVLLGWKRWHAEGFAVFYEGCRMGYDPADETVRFVNAYSGVLKPERVRRLCAWLVTNGSAR